MGRLRDTQWAALDPSVMGLGPVHAVTPLLKRRRLKMDDIDYWEINEAFAAQVLACRKAWADKDYCRKQLWYQYRPPGWCQRRPHHIASSACTETQQQNTRCRIIVYWRRTGRRRPAGA
jgi:hypothetical protein